MKIFDINPKTQKIIKDPDLDFDPKKGWHRVVPYKDFLKKCDKIDKAKLKAWGDYNKSVHNIIEVLNKKD